MKNIFSTALLLSSLGTVVAADITIRFQDSAPKDLFTMRTNCPVADMQIVIDLTQSAGSLIFDVTADGAGVAVFQPVEVQAGAAQTQTVVDGDQKLSLFVDALTAGAEIVISADLDDVLPQSQLGQTRVTGSELDGTSVTIDFAGMRESATFSGGTNEVSFPYGCLS